jgi:hypothetical protein
MKLAINRTQALGEGEGARAAGRVLNLSAASLFLGSLAS